MVIFFTDLGFFQKKRANKDPLNPIQTVLFYTGSQLVVAIIAHNGAVGILSTW